MKNKKKKRTGSIPGTKNTRCPYCGSIVILRSADGIYRDNTNNTTLFVCSKYPECDAYVRVQPGTKNVPLGKMANGELRALRFEAHRYFDQIHQSGLMEKRDAYVWLSRILAVPVSHAHIGHLGDYYCKVVIHESKSLLERNKNRISRNFSDSMQQLPKVARGKLYASQ